MEARTSPIDLLTTVASDYDATVETRQSNAAWFRVAVRSADGRVTEFRIEARAYGAQVVASEEEPRLLPKTCPERHINAGGSFCLSWQPDVDLAVGDLETAGRWWTQLIVFLRLQLRAGRRKVWPGPEWAHGEAAKYQRSAELAAAHLGLSEALSRGDLELRTLERRSKRGECIRLLMNRGVEICSYWGAPLRVINQHRACICPRGDIRRHRRLRNCCTHANDALLLANSLILWRKHEDDFWATLEEQPCCGTMKKCRLKKQNQAA
ncbi:MAG: E2 domain-containing protein [Pseudomarimonas sp.]